MIYYQVQIYIKDFDKTESVRKKQKPEQWEKIVPNIKGVAKVKHFLNWFKQ